MHQIVCILPMKWSQDQPTHDCGWPYPRKSSNEQIKSISRLFRNMGLFPKRFGIAICSVGLADSIRGLRFRFVLWASGARVCSRNAPGPYRRQWLKPVSTR